MKQLIILIVISQIFANGQTPDCYDKFHEGACPLNEANIIGHLETNSTDYCQQRWEINDQMVWHYTVFIGPPAVVM